MSEFDTGYSVVIGKPVVHADKKATGSSVSFPCEAIPDGSYLVSLEVNGSVKAYRESMDFSSGSCTVGEYTLSYSSYALTVSGTSNNDIVRVMVEPSDVKTTDAFRAAVKKDAPEAPNELPAVTASDAGKVLSVNNSGVWGAQEPIGKKFIVTCTPSDETFTFGQMDKTVGEIKQAVDAGMEVWFQMTLNQNLTGSYVCNGINHYPTATYGYVFVAMFVLTFGVNSYLAQLTTSSNSEDDTVWVSTIFPLTPAT